jgi:hypothetical protein
MGAMNHAHALPPAVSPGPQKQSQSKQQPSLVVNSQQLLFCWAFVVFFRQAKSPEFRAQKKNSKKFFVPYCVMVYYSCTFLSEWFYWQQRRGCHVFNIREKIQISDRAGHNVLGRQAP